MQTIHYIMIVAGSLATGLPALDSALPAGAHPFVLGGAAVCALVATVCGALSDKIGTKKDGAS